LAIRNGGAPTRVYRFVIVIGNEKPDYDYAHVHAHDKGMFLPAKTPRSGIFGFYDAINFE